MYSIYVVLTRTNTMISKLIRLGTGHSYNHVSISLDDNLKELYSFGRRGKRNPFNGGFVTESFNRGILSSRNTRCKVYRILINEEQFKSLKDELGLFKVAEGCYGYNYLGAIMLRLNLTREHKSKYFCSQFVAFVLDRHKVLQFKKNPNLYFPADFEKHNELNLIYEGSADIYRNTNINVALSWSLNNKNINTNLFYLVHPI